jgi:histone H3/H4
MSDQEVLVVVSKLKAYIREKSGMSTSGGAAGTLSVAVRRLCDQAIERARADGRKTVMERDFTPHD